METHFGCNQKEIELQMNVHWRTSGGPKILAFAIAFQPGKLQEPYELHISQCIIYWIRKQDEMLKNS